MLRSLARYDQLIAEELAGIITPEDQAALDEAKAVFPEVNELWEAKHAVLTRAEVQKWADQQMTPPVVSNRPVMKRYKRVLLVAAVLLPIFVTYLISRPAPETVFLPPPTIELRLESGKVFDLSNARKEEGDLISLNIQDTILTFSSSSTEQATLSVPDGKDYSITLPDSTKVRLNSASSISFPLSFSATSRNVTLHGEAYFEVTRDPNRPFTVSMQNAKVEVVGTSFNVNSYDKKHPVVALVSGGVNFHAGKKSQALRPGQAGTYNGKGIDTTNFNAQDLLGWQQGLFKFRDASLEDLCKLIPRWFARKVVIDQPKADKGLYTGDFDRNKTLEENLEQLKYYGIGYEVKNDLVHIIRLAEATR